MCCNAMDCMNEVMMYFEVPAVVEEEPDDTRHEPPVTKHRDHYSTLHSLPGIRSCR